MLFLLLSAQRCQTLHLIEVDDIIITENSLTIKTSHLLKQTKPGMHLEPIELKSFDEKTLCIVSVMSEYLKRTKAFRAVDNKKLLIGTIKPFGPVSKSTVARWIKLILTKSGIDQSFGAHSVRSATTSAAHLKGVSLETIIKTAGWANTSMFAKYYNKPIQNRQLSVQEAILSSHV